MVHTVAIAVEWWRELEANSTFVCFQRRFYACAPVCGCGRWVCWAMHACGCVCVCVCETKRFVLIRHSADDYVSGAGGAELKTCWREDNRNSLAL